MDFYAFIDPSITTPKNLDEVGLRVLEQSTFIVYIIKSKDRDEVNNLEKGNKKDE